MGLAEWGARKIKRVGKKGDNNEPQGVGNTDDKETSGVRQLPKKAGPYRDAPLTTSDLSRADLERVLKGLLQRRPKV